MKPALVLGFALAANAMADNELIMAPTDKFSRDLAQRFPGKIMFDDELFVQYPPVELFGSYEEWLSATRNYHISRDDAVDDELALKIVHLPPAEHVAYNDDELPLLPKDLPYQDGIRRFYTPYFDKETGTWKVLPYQSAKLADDELFASDPTVIVIRIPSKSLQVRDDEAVDDELGVKFVHPPNEHVAYDDDELLVRPLVPHIAADDDEFAVILRSRDSFKSEEDYQKYFRRAFVTYDDAADDELGTKIVHRAVADRPTFAFDDDELRIRPISVLPESIAADDELSFMPLPPKVFVKSEWFKTTKTTPEALIRDDEADDELAFTVKVPRVVVDKSLIKPVKNTASEALVRDDEADDELTYLGQLIKDGAWIPRTFDDELRAEKPSHVKAEERAQLKSELLKKPRKLRPHPDVIPMVEN